MVHLAKDSGKCQNPVHAACTIGTVPKVLTSALAPKLRQRKEAALVAEVRSPVVRRRELGTLLRGLRLEKELTVEQVAASLLCSPSKVSRMETGRGLATPRDIRDLCDLYGVTDDVSREHMMQLAVESKQQGWWQAYDLPYSRYVGLEAEALSIHGYQSSVVPGLLQTTGYARALHEAASVRLSPEEIEQRVEVRVIRQELLARDRPPRFAEVIDEAALHRVVGGHSVMDEQLARLVEACALPNVTIQVIPFVAGAHPALENNFKVLELPPPSPGVVYVEGLLGSFYLERAEELDSFNKVFEQLQVMALSPGDSVELITEIRDSLISQ
jgi:transcriptional regulator with XRE-family HTH domain